MGDVNRVEPPETRDTVAAPDQGSDQGSEMTIDRLAASVGMTVRNVRAYAGRGLIPAPRLVGRTGWYGEEHASRLRLIRDLIDRGYTLGAIERTLLSSTGVPAGHALDLLATLANPLGEAEVPEEIDAEALTRLAGRNRDDDLLDQLAGLGLIERLDGARVRLLRPSVVRAGAQAMALGLSQQSVLELLPLLSDRLRDVAQRFVDEFRAQLWHPFTEAGMPDEEWPQMLQRIESILPVAGQAVVSVFRDELGAVIEQALGEELQAIGDGEGRPA